MDADYTKRELDEHFKILNDKVDFNTRITESLDKRVAIQNGRTSKLESKVWGVLLAGSAVVALFGVISGLIVYSFHLSQDNLRQSILLEVHK